MRGFGTVDLAVEVAGEVQVRERLEGIMERVEDWTPALREMAREFRSHMAEVFATEGAATRGGGWAPLSPAYAAWKARHYPGAPLLVQSGRLRAAMTGQGAGAVERIGPQELVVGGSRPVGRGWDLGLIHQRPVRARVPQRKIIDMPEALVTRWVQILAEHVDARQDR